MEDCGVWNGMEYFADVEYGTFPFHSITCPSYGDTQRNEALIAYNKSDCFKFLVADDKMVKEKVVCL